ncbi:disulfide bond formation protein B [Alkalimarinus sediminis]|uniref:Disulfide bond formation protein B n=1 Tax=Alkalimarinus sediminis TaxID=1632866 RepID=A0A9E8HID2_9ALTE|nr:disulfide bond formation protein B [Alkalimarinus sediminis]UZW74747.1 disulfide bond formation protein B [Alkalimarinus sediminis]
MTIPATRLLNLLLFLACSSLMAFAFFLEYIKGLEPCPLCMSQRIVVITIGVLALIAAIHNPAKVGTKIYGVLLMLVAGIGAGLSSRQLWLQSLPADEIPACGPGLSYIVDNMEYFPMQEVLTMMLSGTGDCAEVQWVFLGLSIPGWTLVVFISIGLMGLFQLLRKS